MYIKRLIIKNYRSIKYLDVNLTAGKNVIVGRNNAGKSNIVKALDILLGEKVPTWKSENIVEGDFYLERVTQFDGSISENRSDSLSIYCELDMLDGETLNFEEINKCRGYFKYVENKTYGSPEDTRAYFQPIESYGEYDEFVEAIFDVDLSNLDSNNKRWVDSKLKDQFTFNQELADKKSFAFAFEAKRNEGSGFINKDMRLLYRTHSRGGWELTFGANIRNELIQSAIVPSFRDPNDQLRINSWTWYGKLLRSLTDNHPKTDELKTAFEGVGEVANKIFEDVQKAVQSDTFNVAFPGTKLFFQFNNDVNSDVYKSCSIYVDDGIKSPLFDKGSGIQSAIIISLFSYYSESIAKNNTLLCVEEPELYLHPHARRVISAKLDNFVSSGNQVIATTHSSEFINSVDCNLNIITVKRADEGGTIASNLDLGRKKSLLIDNNYNELFFADAAIICEGYDEKLIKWVAEECFPGKLDELNISIIPSGGKDNLADLVRVIYSKLRIKTYFIADFDFLLRGGTHKSIENLRPEYFKEKYIFGNQGSARFIEVEKLRRSIKEANEELFNKAKTIDEIEGVGISVKDLTDVLRVNGIGILDGEIEDYSLDNSLLSHSKKLSLESVFKINRELLDGRKITDIINHKHIVQILTKVIDDLS